jgi:transposase
MPLVAVGITLSDEERDALEGIVRSLTSEQRMVTRARVVLAAADEKPNRQIAREVGLSERKVGVWRNRFAEQRLEGLRDLPRPGKPCVYDHDKQVEVFKMACSPPPEGETHWTVRSLAEAVGVGKSQTHAFLSQADLKPHQVRSWLTSLDPDFDTKQADVCGLYLSPPENAIVASLDEKTSIQARQPIRIELAMEPGKPARREFEYKRHGASRRC